MGERIPMMKSHIPGDVMNYLNLELEGNEP